MEQIQKQPTTKKQHPAWWKILQRVLAAVLAFAMVLSTSLLMLTRVTQPDDETISQSTAEIAYQSISEDNKYLTASTSERVRMCSAESEGSRDCGGYDRLVDVRRPR
jgi:uncharacterized protein YpmS